MASYDAQINLLISGQRELDRLANRLQAIERQIVDINRLGVRPQQRDPVTGRFGADPDRANRVALSRLQAINKQEERIASARGRRLREQNNELLNSIRYQSQLNAAVDLYERRLEQLSRGGGGRRLTEQLRDQVDEIQRAFDVATDGGTKNLATVRSLATELGRVVERQNEINRLSTFQSKAFFQAQAFERQMLELRSRGAVPGSFGSVGAQMRDYRSAIARGSEFEATDIARRIKEALSRIARELESSLEEARISSNLAALRQRAERSWEQFFEDVANSTLQIRQRQRDTSRSWQEFFEDAAQETRRLRSERLSRFAFLRGDSAAYGGAEIGPLPAGMTGAPRYFQESEQIQKELLEVEKEIADIREKSTRESLRLETERINAVEKRRQKEKQIIDMVSAAARKIGGAAMKAGGATLDAVTFGQGAKVARGVRNAAIRGGLGLGALGLGGLAANMPSAMWFKMQELQAGGIASQMNPANAVASGSIKLAGIVGGAINDALGGVPAQVAQALAAIGEIPQALGLAAVAALAFAPAMKTAADAVYLAGKKFGETKFGENIKLTLDRQTNLFEDIINQASKASMDLGEIYDETERRAEFIQKLTREPLLLPAAGGTSFQGPIEYDPRIGAFVGGGVRPQLQREQGPSVSGRFQQAYEALAPAAKNAEFLVGATGKIAGRSEEAAAATLMFAEGLGQAAKESKAIAEYLEQANNLRRQGESSAQRFIRQTRERGEIELENQRSAQIARERSALLLGGQYPLSQVPAGGELFPGGRTETAQKAYREMLNAAAMVKQLQQSALDKLSEQQGFVATIGQLERRTINDKGRSLAIQQKENEELERSIQIIRERNKELRQRPIAAMTPEERISQGILDPDSLRAQRRRRVEIGRLDPLERFYAGFQSRRQAERSARATSEGLIGGAFPLLFGQGLGASIGGGVGGFAGGFAGGGLGFGLSLIGTALGTAFDTLSQAAQDTGRALKYPTESFEKLKEAGLFASRQQEYYISKLIESGRIQEAQVEIQAEIIKKIGVSGVNDLTRLGDASTKLSKAWAEFNLQLQVALAGPMASLLEWVAAIVGAANQRNAAVNQLRDIEQGLSGAKRDEFLNKLNRIDVAEGGIGRGILNDFGVGKADVSQMRADLIKEFASFANLPTAKGRQTPEEQEAVFQKSRQVADEIKSAYREGFQLQQQAIDLQRQGADLQRRIAEDIFNKQQEIQRRQIEADQLRKEIAIETVDLEYRRRIANEEGRVAEVLAAEAEVMRTKAEGEAQIESKKRLLELDIAKQKRETENYIYQLNKDIDGIRRATLNYEMNVADYRLKIQRQIEDEIRITQAGSNAGGRTNLPGGQTPGTGFTVDQLNKATQAASKFNGVANMCSESVKTFYESLGVSLPGVTEWADSVRKAGTVMRDWSKLRPGDIVATGRPGDTPHVGVYTGGTNVFHQSASRGLKAGNYPDLGYFKEGGYFVRPNSRISQYQSASAGISRPNVPMVSPGAVGGQMTALNARDEAIQRQSLNLEQQLTELKEQGALQRLYEVAQGEKDIAQRRQALSLAKTEFSVIGAFSQDRQESLLFEAQALEKIITRKAEDEKILQNTKLQGQERQKLIDQLAIGLSNTQKQIELDRELLTLAQQRRFEEEKTGLQRQIQTTGAGLGAGFVGGAAQAYESELMRSGSAIKAREIAELTNQLTLAQVQAEGMQQSILAVGDAFGTAMTTGVAELVKGTATAQEVFAEFLNAVANALLQAAAQMIATYVAIGIARMFAGFGSSSGTLPGAAPQMTPGAIVTPAGFQGQFAGIAAKGAYFDGAISHFAKGGMFTNSIVSSPTLFRFADGAGFSAGLMGEAGPEAIMPLTRGPGGRLGVDASGSGESINVTVNVDASGSKVQGDDQNANQLGRVVANAVQQELIKQKRPGGLLS